MEFPTVTVSDLENAFKLASDDETAFRAMSNTLRESPIALDAIQGALEHVQEKGFDHIPCACMTLAAAFFVVAVRFMEQRAKQQLGVDELDRLWKLGEEPKQC